MPIHPVLLASGAVMVVSVATALAIYESPELRRRADDVRRRIVLALHSMSQGIQPDAHREPRFNRPEDADGFLTSHRGLGVEPGVDADDETRRKQWEELKYWNRMRLEKIEKEESIKEKDVAEAAPGDWPSDVGRLSAFDVSCGQDGSAVPGTYVFNTGNDARDIPTGLRHRGAQAQMAATTIRTNYFPDGHYSRNNDASEAEDKDGSLTKDESVSDLYGATTVEADESRSANLEHSTVPDAQPMQPQSGLLSLPSTLERILEGSEFMSAGQDDRTEAYASIQAWAQNSSQDFDVPLPVTPTAAMSEPELISDGQLTPTDSMSLIGPGEDMAREAQSPGNGALASFHDVLSESEGMPTPASWSEVGSVVSDGEAALGARLA